MTINYFGSAEPRTEEEISKIPCARCGAPSRYQWNACANGNHHVAICRDCDVEVNRMVLDFFRIPGREEMMAAYEERTLW